MGLVLWLFASCLSSAIAQGVLHLNEGDICKDGSPPWYCKLQSDCTTLKDAIRRRQYPKLCSFRGFNTPVICCPAPSNQGTTQPPQAVTNSSLPAPNFPKPPAGEGPPIWGGSGPKWPPSGGSPTNKPSDGSKAEKMCKAYEKYVWKTIPSPFGGSDRVHFCGMVAQPLIVGGENASAREFPHMARIGYGERPRIEWLCGGSLISERFILSAAHCTKPRRNKIASWANLGDLDVSTDLDEAEPVTIRIIERIDHPGYKDNELYHDIALYKLERDAPLGIYIRPICLNTLTSAIQPKAIASGWGLTSWKGRESSLMQKVELNLVPNRRCSESYKNNPVELPQGIVPERMICAGGVGGKDTCQGDSGGPLQIPLRSPFCMYSIIGVTSFGRKCATGTPGVYTNVANYVNWIENIVWPT